MSNRWTVGRLVMAGQPWNDEQASADAAWWRVEPEKIIVGTPGDDVLHGTREADTIDGGAGADEMHGRRGNDTYIVDNPGDVVREGLDAGIDEVVADLDWKLGNNVENLTLRGQGGTEDLQGTGNALANVIVGNMGENRLEGRGGDDLIKSGGSSGAGDTLVGGAGNDTLLGGVLATVHDLLQGGEGDDVLQVSHGANVLDGGAGNDMLTGGDGDGLHTSTPDTLIGGDGQDTLNGGVSLDGGDGDDSLHFTMGLRALGGSGNDTISGTGFGNLLVDAGTGNDSVSVQAVGGGLTLFGGDGNDVLYAAAATTLVIDAGIGDDRITIAPQNRSTSLQITCGDGNDTVLANALVGNSTIDGGAGDDNLSCSTSNGSRKLLLGGDGNDTLSLTGGMGDLGGGFGQDLFVLKGEAAGAYDLMIRGFHGGEDRIGVSQSSLHVGNGDLQVDGAVAVAGPGGFDAGAELVIVAADVIGGMSLEAAAAAIGSANQAYSAGQTAVFMVDDGRYSYALYFESSGADAKVSAAELSFLVGIEAPSIGVNDVVWNA